MVPWYKPMSSLCRQLVVPVHYARAPRTAGGAGYLPCAWRRFLPHNPPATPTSPYLHLSTIHSPYYNSYRLNIS